MSNFGLRNLPHSKAKYKDKRIGNINQKLEEVKRKIIETLGESTLTPSGELKSECKDTPGQIPNSIAQKQVLFSGIVLSSPILTNLIKSYFV